MAAVQKKTPKLTDAERHERFKEMAREVGASEDEADFERAFNKVAKQANAPKRGAVD